MSIAPETFHDELRRFRRSLAIYNMRHHLAHYPRDLVRHWWRVERGLPTPSSGIAYHAWKTGLRPGHLYQGPPHWPPQLRVIEGGALLST
jgi:hypothetical protein